jgi:hypothetical protein
MAKAKTRRKRRAPRAVSATAEIYDVNWKAAKIIDKSTYKINRRTGLVVTSLVAIGHELNTIKELLRLHTTKTVGLPHARGHGELYDGVA